jgi:hypothetical protein
MSRRIYRFRARPLMDSLRLIRRAGTRLPALTVGGYRIGLAPSNGRLYVHTPMDYLGEISASGIFRPKKPLTPKEVEPIRAIIERTVEVVQAVAAVTKGDVKCAICNRILLPQERKKGFSPRCWTEGEFNTYERRAIAWQQRSSKIGTGRSSARNNN